MQLIEETFESWYHGQSDEYYVRQYNENGLLVYERSGDHDSNRSKENFYNEDKTISKTLELIQSNCGFNLEEKTETIYEYSGENYRIISYLKQIRDNNDINTYENLVLGNEIWHDVDQIISIHEFKVDKGLLLSERYNNIQTNTRYSFVWTYKDRMKISEVKSESGGISDGTISETKYTYSGKILKSEDYFINNKFQKKIEFIYESDLLLEEKTFLHSNSLEYLAYQKKYSFNDENGIKRIGYYGRYNSKMYLYKIEETLIEDNRCIKKEFSIPNHEILFGHYDLQSLNAISKIKFEQTRNEGNAFIDIVTNNDLQFVEYKEDLLDTLELMTTSHIVEVYDYLKNLIEYKNINPANENEIYERKIYHNEYTTVLEFTICFDIDEHCGVEKSYIKKFYYRK